MKSEGAVGGTKIGEREQSDTSRCGLFVSRLDIGAGSQTRLAPLLQYEGDIDNHSGEVGHIKLHCMYIRHPLSLNFPPFTVVLFTL